MKTKHTQGEWEIAKSRTASTYIRSKKEGFKIATIAPIDEHDANANLVASAPDMLEALTKLVEWANISDSSPNRMLRDECLAAIQKATT